jgi:hypothetical protein
MPEDAQKLSALVLENLGISPDNAIEIQKLPHYISFNRAAQNASHSWRRQEQESDGDLSY